MSCMGYQNENKNLLGLNQILNHFVYNYFVNIFFLYLLLVWFTTREVSKQWESSTLVCSKFVFENSEIEKGELLQLFPLLFEYSGS